MVRQIDRNRRADTLDAQRRDHPVKRAMFGGFNRVKQLLHLLLAKAFQLQQWLRRERENVALVAESGPARSAS